MSFIYSETVINQCIFHILISHCAHSGDDISLRQHPAATDWASDSKVVLRRWCWRAKPCRRRRQAVHWRSSESHCSSSGCRCERCWSCTTKEGKRSAWNQNNLFYFILLHSQWFIRVCYSKGNRQISLSSCITNSAIIETLISRPNATTV